MSILEPTDPLLVIIGPSGSGKSTIVHELHRQGLVVVTPTWTTRPPRPGELEHGLEHVFIHTPAFMEKVRENFFLDYDQMFGLPFHYGLPQIKAPGPNKVPLIMLRAPLLERLKKHYSSFTVYQISDNIGRVRTRLEERTRHGEKVGSRLTDYQTEVTLGEKLAHRSFVNDDNVSVVVANIKEAMVEDFGLAP